MKTSQHRATRPVGWENFARGYSYDSLNRLSTMSDSNTAQQCRGLSWTYDAWGNRNNQTVTAGTCPAFSQAVNSQNQLSGSPFQYDAAGNLTADGNHTYMYDAENRLIQVDSTGGYCSSSGNTATATACYVYDALGRRSVKIPSSGVWAQYFYDLNSNVVAEFGNGCGPTCWTNGYVYFNGSLLAEYENSSTDFVHKDHLGSTRLLTDVTAYYVTQCLDYLPFGDLTSSSTSCESSDPPIPGTTTHEFTGDQRDAETAEPVGGSNGLDHTQFRQYSSSLGRWMTPDPAGLAAVDPTNPQSWNRYAYALNNPLSNIDPTGLDCVYLNDAGDRVESIDSESDIGGCEGSGGYWANGYIPNDNGIISDPSYVLINSNDNSVLIYSYINGQLGLSLATQTWTQGAFGLGEAPSSFFPSFEPSYTWGQTYSQQLLGAAAKGASLAAHVIPVACGGGVFAYAGPAGEKGSAEGSANVLLEYDTNQGFTVNGLFEGGQVGGPGGGAIVGKTGVTPLGFIPTGGAGGVVVLNGAVGLYAGGGAGPVGYGAGAYVNITSAAGCH